MDSGELNTDEKNALQALNGTIESLLEKMTEPVMMWILLTAAGAAGVVGCVIWKRKIRIESSSLCKEA